MLSLKCAVFRVGNWTVPSCDTSRAARSSSEPQMQPPQKAVGGATCTQSVAVAVWALEA